MSVVLDEDDELELCIICDDAPAIERDRCGDCLAYLRRNMHDRPTPRQNPKLSALEATLVRMQQVQRERVEWLMTPESSDPPSLLEVLERPAWMAKAACRGMDVSTFVTDRGQDIRPAKAICTGCPVRAECEAYALAESDLFGVWGGTSQRDRREHRRQLAS
jgi:WhiB family redox-sensing transcriptional regulator